MVLASNLFKASVYRLVLLPAVLTVLSSCASISSLNILLNEADAALLIRQDEQENTLTSTVAKKKFSDPEDRPVDPKRLLAKPSNSVAVEKNAENSSLHSSPDLLSSPAISAEQAEKTLVHYLAMVEDQPERIESILTNAEQLAQQYPDDSVVQSLWQRLNRYCEWQPVNLIINSAGIDMVSISGWQPESPQIRIRRALLPPLADNEQVVFGDQRLVLIMVNPDAVSLEVDASLEDIPFLPQSPVVMLYQVDENPPEQIALNDQDEWRRVTLSIPSGEHAVRFYQEQPVGNQYIKLRFVESGAAMSIAQERPYFISTAAQPLEFYANGPSVLRIDELEDGNISYRYQNVQAGWQTIRLPPSTDKPRSLLRVSQRVVNLNPTPPNNRVIKRTLELVPEPDVVTTPPKVADKVELIDAFKLGKQEDGTLSAGFDLVRRNNVQESGTLPEEQFTQYRLNYRYFDEPNDIHWNSEGFFRIREYGNPSFGFEESIYYNPDWLPFNIRSNIKAIAQVPNHRLEALGQWNLALSQAYNLHPKTRIIPGVTFFSRAMSLQTTAFNLADLGLGREDRNNSSKISRALQNIDQDVFTPYKSDHIAGLSPAVTVEHRPWLDTIWSARVSESTNEDFDLTLPDFYRTEMHWQQLLGSVALDASYRVSFFQGDDDSTQTSSDPFSSQLLTPNRKHASKRSSAGLGLNWQHWTAHQQRIEIAGQYNYDIERKAHLATLSFTWHFGEGRGLRDFSPNEIDFRDIRQRQFVDGHNNVMRDSGP